MGEPGTWMLHRRKTVIGIVGDDGNLHTYNRSFPPRMCARFEPIDEADIPPRFVRQMATARKRAESNPEVWDG